MMPRFPVQAALAACWLTAASAPALADSLPARAPGLWQSTTTVTGADGKPLPHAAGIVTVSCVDPVTDIKFFLSNESACTRFSITGSGASYRISGTCTQTGKPVSINETLNYVSPRQVTLTAKLDAPTGPVTVTSQLQWQGDCLAGMAPGDEGSIVGGAFSKVDNINDAANQ
jgi:hypothetical protein